LRDFAQLVRLPNVFTALADIGLGMLTVSAFDPEVIPRWRGWMFLMMASACLYSAGMVWNDFFDIEQDRRERPFRPLPSGRVTRGEAAFLGTFLLLFGVYYAAFAGTSPTYVAPDLVGVFLPYDAGTPPTFVALGLASAILLYDGWLKKTWAGPIGMGLCRFLNVLLGLSVADTTLVPWSARIYLAAVVGIYIVGVTWFSRTEARASSRPALILAACTMLAGLLLALAVPVLIDRARPAVIFPYLLVLLGFLLGVPIVRAINRPIPTLVQPAVKRSIVGLVILDATLATGLVGSPGLLLLLLLLPTLYLGRWIYST
jgi:4-hydroxybenzoate polyprenyltransferase